MGLKIMTNQQNAGWAFASFIDAMTAHMQDLAVQGGQDLTLSTAAPSSYTFTRDTQDPYEPRITAKPKE